MLVVPSLVNCIKNHALFRSFPSRNILIFAFFWVFACLLVNPVGEFPLNDDWAYAGPVKTLTEERRLEISQWPSMTLIAQIGWGWLVSSVFGFSFTALRLSVVLLGFGGMIAVWRVLRYLTGDEQKAMLGALAIGFNGIYFNLSCTFMTDVPYFFCAMWTMYFYMRYLGEKDVRWLAAATLIASLAALIRQIGLLLPAAFMIAMLIRARGGLRAWINGISSFAFVYGVMQACELWREATGRLSNNVYQSYISEVWGKIAAGPMSLIHETSDTMLVSLVMLGLFMLPVLLTVMPWRFRRDRIIAIFLTVGGLVLGIWLACEERQMPLLPQGIFVDFALGPPTLRDVFALQRENLYRAPAFLLWGITTMGCIGAVWLLRPCLLSIGNGLRWLFRGRGDGFRAAVQVLGLSSAFIIFLPLAIKFPFDRYLFACVPGFLLCIAACGLPGLALRRWQKWLAVCFIMGSAVFAVAGTHDYLAWNRARWQALNYLCQELKIQVTNIDGGFEFNGWHLYDAHYKDRPPKSWWWVHDDEFTVTFGLLENHSVIKSFPYPRWCPPRRDFIYILKLSDVNADHLKLAATHHEGGRNVKTRDGDILRYWDGRRGPVTVAHGSFVCLKPGPYRAVFKFAAGRPRKGICENPGTFRVVNHMGGELLAEARIEDRGLGRRQFIQQELPFTVSEDMRVAVHVLGGDIPLWLDSVKFIKSKD